LEVGDDLSLGVHAGRPGELVGRVPLVALRLLVEVAQLLAERLVVPRVAEVEAGRQALDGVVQLGGRTDGGFSHGVLLSRRRRARSRAAPAWWWFRSASRSGRTRARSTRRSPASTCRPPPAPPAPAAAGRRRRSRSPRGALSRCRR